ncbi:MAG: peptidoglycan-binding protein [Clostridiales bacterium]|nr:peptidoglycan-binding protein [Clostridiales bacterium]
MNSAKKLLFIIFIALICVLICSCGPDQDITDPLDIGVDINLPFSTGSVQAITTPKTSIVTGWLGESVTLTEGDYSELSLGSIGASVKNLQKRLIELGYLTGTATGSFDQATVAAVKRFEQMYGREQTGTASQLMQHYLFSDSVRPYNKTTLNTPTPTPTSQGFRTLQRGDSGSDVYKLQQRLTELGYMGSVTGTYFDKATEDAVKDFESAYNKSRTGIATMELQSFLFSSNARTAQQMRRTPTPTPRATATPNPYGNYETLQYGDRGEAVTKLQKRLRELGYMTSKADGLYGEKTYEAIKLFEAAYGKKQTGVATAALQYYLFSSNALRYGTVLTPTPKPKVTATPVYTTLSVGDEGEQVYELQLRLIQLGYLSGNADGIYGNATKTAVMLFEKAYSYSQTGVATPLMQSLLFSDGAKKYAPSQIEYNELSLGSVSQDVKDLQTRLKELNYYSGSINGRYDEATMNAVKAFEAAYGRPETGIATDALQKTLFSAGAKENPIQTSGYSTLSSGDKGDAVKRLQQRLKDLGYLSGTVDGVYGDGTAQAVKLFEAEYGKTQTGVASAQLQAYLFSANAKANSSGSVAVSYSTLQSGDKGEEVKKLQNRLIALGYLTGSANGTFDSRTVNAVKAFQKQKGENQTGIASPSLQKELYASNAPYNSEDKLVTVNKPAVVSSKSAAVYKSIIDSETMMTLSKGTEVTVLRTRGIWAEIQTKNEQIGYMHLSDLQYKQQSQQQTQQQTQQTVTVTTVNKAAVITASKVKVYAKASTDSKSLGTLSIGTKVTWLRTAGEWAEIKNAAGNVGYVKTSQLALQSGQIVSSYGYTTLKNGDKGEKVKSLQARLKQLGYHNGEVKGNYLAKTTEAVKRFQSQIGLKPDGVATASLQEILFSSYAPKTAAAYQNGSGTYTAMYLGRKDAAVGTLQKRLVELGLLSQTGTTYGTYDNNTLNAIKKVQQIMGLTEDGLASPELQAYLLSRYGTKLKQNN